jgi:hypothetical protein
MDVSASRSGGVVREEHRALSDDDGVEPEEREHGVERKCATKYAPA